MAKILTEVRNAGGVVEQWASRNGHQAVLGLSGKGDLKVPTPSNPRSSDEQILSMMRAIVVVCALAFTVLTALTACAPTPQETAPVKAEQQKPSSCGGDQGMATQFYRDLNGAPSMGPPPSKCP